MGDDKKHIIQTRVGVTKRYFCLWLACAVLLGGLTAVPAPVLADGHIKKGEKVYRKCRACHGTKAGEKKIGPTLFGIYGRKAAAVEGFKYSEAMRASGIVWDDEALDKFLHKPRKFLKGTKMSFGGVRKAGERADLIAYLKTLK